MFTENVREICRQVPFPQRLGRWLFGKLKVPFIPIYGGFPVKLVSHIGDPIYPRAGETAEELTSRVKESLESLIQRNQKLPGNTLRALFARI